MILRVSANEWRLGRFRGRDAPDTGRARIVSAGFVARARHVSCSLDEARLSDVDWGRCCPAFRDALLVSKEDSTDADVEHTLPSKADAARHRLTSDIRVDKTFK